jgi:hypothetical protein
LLASIANHLILFDQHFDQFVNWFDILHLNNWQIFNKSSEFLLLREKGRVLEITL